MRRAGRCGFARMPLLVISPLAKVNHFDHHLFDRRRSSTWSSTTEASRAVFGVSRPAAARRERAREDPVPTSRVCPLRPPEGVAVLLHLGDGQPRRGSATCGEPPGRARPRGGRLSRGSPVGGRVLRGPRVAALFGRFARPGAARSPSLCSARGLRGAGVGLERVPEDVEQVVRGAVAAEHEVALGHQGPVPCVAAEVVRTRDRPAELPHTGC